MMSSLMALILFLQFFLAAVHAIPLTVRIWDSDTSTDGIQFAEYTIRTVSPSLDQTKPQLPSPSPDLKLKYVTLGRGTQNYTCSSSDASTSPSAVGAVATLFDASWIVASVPKLLDQVPPLLEQLPLDNLTAAVGALDDDPSSNDRSLAIGKHYFKDTTTPFFDFRISGLDDWAAAQKSASVNAPSPSAAVLNDVSTSAVPWLQLIAKDGVGIKVSVSLSQTRRYGADSMNYRKFTALSLLVVRLQLHVRVKLQASRFSMLRNTGSMIEDPSCIIVVSVMSDGFLILFHLFFFFLFFFSMFRYIVMVGIRVRDEH